MKSQKEHVGEFQIFRVGPIHINNRIRTIRALEHIFYSGDLISLISHWSYLDFGNVGKCREM